MSTITEYWYSYSVLWLRVGLRVIGPARKEQAEYCLGPNGWMEGSEEPDPHETVRYGLRPSDRILLSAVYVTRRIKTVPKPYPTPYPVFRTPYLTPYFP